MTKWFDRSRFGDGKILCTEGLRGAPSTLKPRAVAVDSRMIGQSTPCPPPQASGRGLVAADGRCQHLARVCGGRRLVVLNVKMMGAKAARGNCRSTTVALVLLCRADEAANRVRLGHLLATDDWCTAHSCCEAFKGAISFSRRAKGWERDRHLDSRPAQVRTPRTDLHCETTSCS